MYRMGDKDKAREELITELAEMRQRIAELEAADTERKRAERALEQHAAQLEALREMGLEITAELDLDTLLHSIVSQAIELLGGTAGGLYLYQPYRDVLEWSVSVGSKLAPIGTVLRRGEGLAGKVWEASEPLIVDDYQHWEGRAGAWEGYPVRAVVGAPVRWGEEFLGVLNVHTDIPHAFSVADAELLGSFATQAAIAIENARLFERLEWSLEQLTALRQTSLDITARLDTTTLLEAIVRRATELLQAKGGGIYFYDPIRQELTVVVDYGLKRSVVGTTLELGEGMSGRVAQTGAPLIVDDYRTWPGRSEQYAEDQFTAVVEIPLKWQDQVIGTLAIVDDVEKRVFTEDDAQLLSLFADQAAIAIENARLYEAAQQEITQRKRAEEERERLLAELEAKNRELNSFVYTVSHDLKAPLVSLDGFSSMLQKECYDRLGEQGQHYLDRLQANVSHMGSLVTHLLELSRIGRVVGPTVEIDVAALVREIREDLAVKLEEVEAELVIREPLPTIRADRTRIRQVFTNLIDNAVKFRSEERPLRIEVGCREEGGFHRFHVSDNGIGIVSQYQEQVFKPFQQLEAETEGVGMGLALVKRIVEHHGGRVWVESELGQGATFYFTLPSREEES
jgi:signal transduction histidine kinase